MSDSTPSGASPLDSAADRPQRVRVGVGALDVVTDDATLVTSGVGSCVAVAMTDSHAGVRGLLHAMLPSSSTAQTPPARPGKYVDTGIEVLIEELTAAGATPSRLEAQLAGGAEMLDLTAAVGPQNVDHAREVLAELQIPITASDVGADVGRTVRLVAGGELIVRAADGFERTIS